MTDPEFKGLMILSALVVSVLVVVEVLYDRQQLKYLKQERIRAQKQRDEIMRKARAGEL